MKTLATCKPTEFLAQTNKIRHFAEKWLKDTQILEIRKTQPNLKVIPQDATQEEKDAIFEENKQAAEAQARENLSKMFDAMFEQYPEETIKLLAMCCFIEPEKADDEEVSVYLDAFAELVGNRSVLNFFTSLVRLGVISTSNA